MFKTPVTATPFSTEAANAYFQNIDGESYNGDVSFLSTLRAFMAKRIPDGESITLRFSTSNYNEENVKSNPAERMIDAICAFGVHRQGVIQIHSLNSPISTGNLACYHLLHASFAELYPGWHRIDDVTNLFKKNFNVLCFINVELKSVILFVERLNLKKLHLLQSVTLGLFPWYFKTGGTYSELDKKLALSFKEGTADKYMECLKEIASQFDFETTRIKMLLRGFETRYERDELQRIEEEVVALNDRISWLNNEIGQKLREINDRNVMYLGLQAKIAGASEEGSELMDYFLCNRNLVLKSSDGDSLVFAVKTYVEYFDEDVVKRYLGNRTSYVYNIPPRNITTDQLVRLMRAVFLDQTIKLRFCAAYRLSLSGNVDPQTNFDFGQEFYGYMPNPHINRWHCMGNYMAKINELLRNQNYIAAIEQCVASAKSLNWTDGTVMNTFLQNVCDGVKAFELPDGSVVGTVDAVKWLGEQEEAASQSAAEVNEEVADNE